MVKWNHIKDAASATVIIDWGSTPLPGIEERWEILEGWS
jgi:hypothetical protein